MPSASRTPAHRRRTSLSHLGWDHGNPRPLDIRNGDTVVVLAGKDRGRRGTVSRVLLDQQRIIVEGVNVLKRHTRSGVQGNAQGGIVDFAAALHYSNVQLICPNCDKPTRVAHATREEDGERTQVFVCKRCEKDIPRRRA